MIFFFLLEEYRLTHPISTSSTDPGLCNFGGLYMYIYIYTCWLSISFNKLLLNPHFIRLKSPGFRWLRFCTATGPVPFFLCFSSKYCMGSVWTSMMWGISVGKRGSKLLWRSYSTGHIPQKKCNQPILRSTILNHTQVTKKKGGRHVPQKFGISQQHINEGTRTTSTPWTKFAGPSPFVY